MGERSEKSRARSLRSLLTPFGSRLFTLLSSFVPRSLRSVSPSVRLSRRSLVTHSSVRYAAGGLRPEEDVSE